MNLLVFSKNKCPTPNDYQDDTISKKTRFRTKLESKKPKLLKIFDKRQKQKTTQENGATLLRDSQTLMKIIC